MTILSGQSVLASALALTVLVGCDDVTVAHFSVDESLPESTVRGIGLSGTLPLTLATIPMDVTSQEAYSREEYDYLTRITLDEMVLTIEDKSDQPEHDSFEDGNQDNFDFISQLTLTINATVGNEEQSAVIARLPEDDPQIASGARTLKLTTTGVDILQYVEAQAGYQIEVNGQGTVPSDDVIFAGQASYRVGVGFR